MMMIKARNIAILFALVTPGLAHASSDAAWDKFAKDVEQKCTDATANVFKRSQVAVDPTGTESFGVAIVYGRSKAEKKPVALVCVVDKKSGKVEIGSELGQDVVRVRKPKPEGEDAAGKTGKSEAGTSGGKDDDADE
jgi:hypothetical protein